MKTVHNDYIVQTLDVFESDGPDGTLTIVSQYCGGGELFDLIIVSQCFKEDKARHIMRRVLLGVAYLHSRGIVHRSAEGFAHGGPPCRSRRVFMLRTGGIVALGCPF